MARPLPGKLASPRRSSKVTRRRVQTTDCEKSRPWARGGAARGHGSRAGKALRARLPVVRTRYARPRRGPAVPSPLGARAELEADPLAEERFTVLPVEGPVQGDVAAPGTRHASPAQVTSSVRVSTRLERCPQDGDGGAEPDSGCLDRAALALVAAEFGERGAWQALDDEALAAIVRDARHLAGSVPLALGRLAGQLALHHETAVRLTAVRILALVGTTCPDEVTLPLLGLLNDSTRKVRKAARVALQHIGVTPDASMPPAGTSPPAILALAGVAGRAPGQGKGL